MVCKFGEDQVGVTGGEGRVKITRLFALDFGGGFAKISAIANI